MNVRRLLVLNFEWPPLGGGASPVSFELAKHLSETGEYDIDVVTMLYKGLPKYEEVNDRLRVHRVRSWRRKKESCNPWEQLTYLIFGYFKARSLIKNGNYDICHTHFIIPTGILAWMLRKQFGLPYVVTSHGSDVLGYNKRFANLYPLLVHPWKVVIDNAKAMITPSQFLKEEILQVYPEHDNGNIVVIPNGIDTIKFTPQKKKPYIFSAGRLLENKGFQYLIQAVSDNDLGWEVHIAGDGPMRAELEKMAEKSKTKVVLHGWLDNNGKEYKDLLEQASIFVLVSESESFGMVIVEAMSAGCAVVTANTSGSAEVVGSMGVVVDPKDAKALGETIKGLINDHKTASTLMIQSRDRARSVYSWDKVASLYQKKL